VSNIQVKGHTPQKLLSDEQTHTHTTDSWFYLDH